MSVASMKETRLGSLVVVDGEASAVSGVCEGRIEGGINERQVGNQWRSRAVGSDRGPVAFVLNTLKRGHPVALKWAMSLRT